MMNSLNKFKDNWSSIGHPTAFRGPAVVARHYRTNKKKAEKFLSHIPVSTIFRTIRKPKEHNPYYAWDRGFLQVDLLDLRGLKQQQHYALQVIDTHSRFLWSELITRKTGPNVVSAMKKILDRMPFQPHKVLCDLGTEFKYKGFQTLMVNNGINLIFTNRKAGTVEKSHLKIQQLLYKQLATQGNNRFKAVWPLIIEAYNNTPHAAFHLALSPAQAMHPANRNTVLNILTDTYGKVRRRKPKFDVGDLVRIKRFRNVFARGYTAHFSDEIYKIKSVNKRLKIPTYTVETTEESPQQLAGTYRQHELIHVNIPL